MVVLGEFRGFLLWMGTASFQSSVNRDLTTASSNAFTENGDNKRHKGASATLSSAINLCCWIWLLEVRSTVVSLWKGLPWTCCWWCFSRGTRGAVSTLSKLSRLLLSLQVCEDQGFRQVVRVESQNTLKLPGTVAKDAEITQLF